MQSERSFLARRAVRASIAALASLAALLVFATGAMAHKGVEHVFIVSQSPPPEEALPPNVAYFSTIQAAVNATAANEYDWILVEPGVYYEEVKVTAAHAGIHIRGMDRNSVILAQHMKEGSWEHIYASGYNDSGIYIGACWECKAKVNDATIEDNAVGYSGSNSGGRLVIENSIFRNNGAGIVPNGENPGDGP